MSIISLKDAQHLPPVKLSAWQRLGIAYKLAVGRFDDPLQGVMGDMMQGVSRGFGGEPPRMHTHDFLLAYSKMPWVRAIAHRVSTDLASVNWRLFVATNGAGKFVRREQLARMGVRERTKMLTVLKAAGDVREIENHPLLNLLRYGNPMLTGTQVDKLISIHLDLVGEAFILYERNGAGMPIEAWAIPPSWVRETPTPKQPRYRIQFRGWTGYIPDSEMLWMVDADPANPFGRGSGVASALADELQADEFAAKTISQTFFNRARPDFLLVAKGAKKAQLERFKEEWLSEHQGFWREARPHFVNWEVEIKEFTRSFRNLQLAELRKQERDIIMQVWGIPPEELGVLEHSNRATIDAADYLYARHVLVPRLEHRRGYWQERLVPEFDERLIIDYDSPIAEDRDAQEKSASVAPWAMKVDEWRAKMGLQPLDGNRGQVFGVPINLRFMREADFVDEAARDAEPLDDEENDDLSGEGDGEKAAKHARGRWLRPGLE